MHSPGHCAQYCTYTMMENDSKKIVALETLDKRETGRKSTNLEKASFQRALEDVKQSNQVTEVVTDWGIDESTSNLEIFNNHILMYATKRISYSPPVYRARNVLVALDYNHCVDLPTATKKDGSIRYQRTFSKKSGRWTTVERKQNKTYAHIDELFERALKMRLESNRGMHHPVELSATDPRRISKTIAPKSPPPTAELVSQEKKSRFK
ncbi:uncharacterized protein LOC130052702 [Ostrea edulis]|uniref:uncharacterized protein LOC130052702 n=1 Tax=Ostrea edulis TaxID=37623 RepID=UPI0024AED2D3|nr:uncharacterized protein LOC130052702 [Ostrea edulis]